MSDSFLRHTTHSVDDQQTWTATWKQGKVEVTGCDRDGYLWDVFKGEDNDIIDYGTAFSLEEALEKCAKVVKQKLDFELQEFD